MRKVYGLIVLFLLVMGVIFAPVFAKGKPVPPVMTEPIPTLIVYPTWIPETPVLTPLPILGN